MAKVNNSHLDNLSANNGMSYDEWKLKITNSYGSKVKFVSDDVPATSRVAMLKDRMISVYIFPRR